MNFAGLALLLVGVGTAFGAAGSFAPKTDRAEGAASESRPEARGPKSALEPRSAIRRHALPNRPAASSRLTAPRERGVALGLFSADPHFSYRGLVDEIVALGASHISVTWVWWQQDLRATEIAPITGWTATNDQVIETVRYAKEKGLMVTALPILRLVEQRKNEWRGRIAPSNEDRWWDSYSEFIVGAARLSERSGARRFAIGSELLSREGMRERWLEIIERVRMVAPRLELLYSANWDHYEHVTFWDAVDVVGLTGYWEIARDLDASVKSLVLSWSNIKHQVLAFSRRLGRPLVFTEVGYPSLDGGAAWPWDETRQATVDLEEQRRAYEAFVRAWSDTQEIEGVYFWNWFGFGGPHDSGYSPRGKPAQAIIEAWFRSERF